MVSFEQHVIILGGFYGGGGGFLREDSFVYYLVSLFLGGRCFPSSFLYVLVPLRILLVYLGSLALTFFVINILLNLLIKKKKKKELSENQGVVESKDTLDMVKGKRQTQKKKK